MAITPNTPNPVREDAYVEELSEKLGIDPQYIPKSPVWRNEEEIAALAEMFANMAGGGTGGGVLVVHDVDGTLDKTWQEIRDADFAVVVSEFGPIKSIQPIISTSAGINDAPYIAIVYDYEQASPIQYTTPSANGYPSYTE